jgi:hypothetical protein
VAATIMAGRAEPDQMAARFEENGLKNLLLLDNS